MMAVMIVVVSLSLVAVLGTPVVLGKYTYGVNNEKVNFTEAKETCVKAGGHLLSVVELTDPRIQDVWESTAEIERIWIEGSVEFSSYVYWIGCANKKIGTAFNAFDTNGIFPCLEFCQKQSETFIYIGLSLETCICLKAAEITMTDDNVCNSTCTDPGDIIASCGSLLFMDVYIIVEVNVNITRTQALQVSQLSQCVYIRPICTSGTPTYFCIKPCLSEIEDTRTHCRNGSTSNSLTKTSCGSNSRCFSGSVTCNRRTVFNRARQNCAVTGDQVHQLCHIERICLSPCKECWTGVFRTAHITRTMTVKTGHCLCANKNATIQLITCNCSDHTSFICKFDNESNETPRNDELPYWLIPICIGSAAVFLFVIILLMKRLICKVGKTNSSQENTSPPPVTYSSVDCRDDQDNVSDNVYDVAGHYPDRGNIIPPLKPNVYDHVVCVQSERGDSTCDTYDRVVLGRTGDNKMLSL